MHRRQREDEHGEEKQSAQNHRDNLSLNLFYRPQQPRSSTSRAAVRPFMCQYDGCGRAFIQKKHLTWHQREKHGTPFGIEREFSFPCQFRGCQRVFYKVGYLRNHMESEHGVWSNTDTTVCSGVVIRPSGGRRHVFEFLFLFCPMMIFMELVFRCCIALQLICFVRSTHKLNFSRGKYVKHWALLLSSSQCTTVSFHGGDLYFVISLMWSYSWFNHVHVCLVVG